MIFSLLPKVQTAALTDIRPDWLKGRDFSLLMLDFDNTIVPYTTDVPTNKMAEWLKTMKDSGVYVCVVSNSRNDRVVRFCNQWGLDCITRAKKPFTAGIRKCMERYGVAPEKCVLVGDQIFTDTLGANCAGVTSVLVKAIDNHNIWLKLRHIAEMPFIFLARKRRLEL